MPPPRPWLLSDCSDDAASSLAGSAGVSPIVARCLILRGARTPEAARAFLRPSLQDLIPPGTCRGMDLAAERIARAIRAKERILVYGDYDMDGVAATALLFRVLRLAGAEVEYHVPHRIADGYGMREEVIALAARRGVTLVVTVDTGITAHREIEAARALGVDVIVTDHHEPAGGPPTAAFAVLDPKVDACEYPFRGITGAGIAFKLAWAVGQALSGRPRLEDGLRAYLLDALALVALGTIADVAPLSGENRALVAYGLKALRATRSPGLRALLASARLQDAVSAQDVAFRLAPRINALGRIGDATPAVELFTTESPDRARAIAASCEAANRRRQDIEQEILGRARDVLQADPSIADSPVAIVAGESWHPGVIGIVAGRLARELGRPVIVIGLEGEEGQGSGRSVPGVHLRHLLDRAADLLIRHGGHAEAAGLRVKRVSVEPLRERLAEAARDAASAPGAAPPVDHQALRIDAEVPLREVGADLVRDLASLAPHGAGNPAPLLAARGARLAGEPRTMGKTGSHLVFYAKDGDAARRAVAFGQADRFEELRSGKPFDLAFRPSVSRYEPGEIELEVEEIRFR